MATKTKIMRVSYGFYNAINNIKNILENAYGRKFDIVEITEKLTCALDIIIKQKNSNITAFEWNFNPIILYVTPRKAGRKKNKLDVNKILDFTPRAERVWS